jgi:hypothetical protein
MFWRSNLFFGDYIFALRNFILYKSVTLIYKQSKINHSKINLRQKSKTWNIKSTAQFSSLLTAVQVEASAKNLLLKK